MKSGSQIHMNGLAVKRQSRKWYLIHDLERNSISNLSEVAESDNMVPPGMSRPCLGMGMVANTGILDSRTLITAGKNAELNSSILPTSSMMKRSVSSLTWFNKKYTVYFLLHRDQSRTNFKNIIMQANKHTSMWSLIFHNSQLLTCSSGNANDSKDATSTLYFPTVGHLTDSELQRTQKVILCANVSRL